MPGAAVQRLQATLSAAGQRGRTRCHGAREGHPRRQRRGQVEVCVNAQRTGRRGLVGAALVVALTTTSATLGVAVPGVHAADLQAPLGEPAAAGRMTADFNNDGFADLAVGVPGEDIGSVTDAGAVHIIYGSSSGLTAAGNKVWSQASAGIPAMPSS